MGALADVLVSRGGYNPTDAANAEKGPRAAELSREFGVGNGGGGGGAPDMTAVNEAIKRQQQGIDQSVGALQQQQQLLPQQTQQRVQTLQGQQSTLEQRYQSLIDEIKQTGQSQEKAQTRVSSEELARRGIPIDSQWGQQQILDSTLPIVQSTQRNLTNTGIARESDLMTITQALAQAPLDEQSQRLALETAIGQVRAGGGESAVQSALQQLQLQQQAQQQAAANSLAQQELAIKQQLAQTNPLDDLLLKAQIADLQSQTSNRNKNSSSQIINYQTEYQNWLNSQKQSSGNMSPAYNSSGGRNY